MRLAACVAAIRPRSKSLLASLSVLVAAALVLFFVPENALAQCSGGSGCVERQGTDSTSVEVEQDAQGGDGVAGSEVISVGGGDGDVRIDADNDSRFSNADGGDVKSEIDVEGESSSGTVVEGSSVQVTSDSDSSATVDQRAAPRSSTIAPLAPPTGASVFSRTASVSNAPVSQEALVDISPDTNSIAAPARALPTVVHDGDTKVVLRSKGSATSGDAIAGGQVIAVVATTGETTIHATNRSVFATATGGDAEGGIQLSTGEEEQPSLALGAPTTLETSNDGRAVVGQTATPQASIVVDGDGEARLTAEAGVVQSATLESSPTVLAAAGEQTTTGTVIHRGDNEVDQELDLDLSGGDAIAGGQVIALSGVGGNVTIEASNRSRNASARGGDATANVRSAADAAPRVSLVPGTSTVLATATGTVRAEQSAAPVVDLSVTQTSGGGTSPAGGGPGNTGTATGSATVQQTASTTSSPTSLNELSPQP